MGTDESHAEILLLLKNAVEDIERTKQRQWRDFYNVVIGQAAILTFGVSFAGQSRFFLAFMIALVLITAAGLGIIKASADTLAQQRKMVEEGYYPKLKNHALLQQPIFDPVHRSTYLGIYMAVIGFVFIFASWMLFSLFPA